MLPRRTLGAALAASIVGANACGRPAPPAAPPNVLLVTIDTLRADRVGAGLTPAIDALAAAGRRYTAARSAVPLTLPSHVTIHTGLLPPQHGVRENGAGALDDRHVTIARLLKGAGYRTAAFVGAFVLDRRFGLARDFDVYDDQIPRDPRATERLDAERPASQVADRAIAWLQSAAASAAPQSAAPQSAAPQSAAPQSAAPQSAIRNPQCFFVWIHFYDPHAPYTPPAEYAARARTPYDGEVMYADAQLGRVLEALRATGRFDDTLVIVAGDHGEGLGDHGERTHGMLAYDSTLRVPLVIKAPARAPAIVDQAVSLAEIAPTIVHAAGVAVPADMKGRDLLAAFGARGATLAPSVLDLYSETEYPRVAGWSPVQALTDGRWKIVAAGGTTEVYDVAADPREANDVAAAQASRAAAMRGRADAIHASGRAGQTRPISADAQERLRALGYVASSAAPAPASGAANPAREIAAWNAFEDALARLNAYAPGAADALKALAAAHPDAAVFQSTYARALKDAGRPLAALVVYRAAAKRWPTDAALIHDLAAAAREAAAAAAGREAQTLRDEALQADRAALALDPDSAMAQNGVGLLAIDDHRPADAARAFERAVSLDPTNASYWTNLGNARRTIGDRAAAEQAFRRALEVDPNTADAANGLGVLLVEAQRPAEAVGWFERALGAAPDLVEARLNLGIALQQSGDPRRAADAYRAVLGAPPVHARERDAAAKLLAALGAAR